MERAGQRSALLLQNDSRGGSNDSDSLIEEVGDVKISVVVQRKIGDEVEDRFCSRSVVSLKPSFSGTGKRGDDAA